MVLQISTYVDPGVYIGEVVVPGAVNIATTPVQLGILGIGDRTKAITNEAVQRGLVSGEALSVISQSGTGTAISAPVANVQTLTNVAGAFTIDDIGNTITIRGATNPSNNGTFQIVDETSTTVSYTNPAGVAEPGYAGTWQILPHATFVNRSNRSLQTTTIFRNGVALGTNFLAFQASYVQGTISATRDFTVPNNAIGVQLDGKVAITIHVTATGPATIITQVGGVGSSQFDVVLQTAAQPATTPITIAEVAAGINAVLNFATDSNLGVASGQGYGPAYANAAVSNSHGLRITSPLAAPGADVRIVPPNANDVNGNAVSRLFTSPTVDAASVITISPLVFVPTAVYLADYINVTAIEDPLLNTGVLSLNKVGTFAGVGNFIQGVDYLQDGNNVDWGGGVGNAPPEVPAQFPAQGVIGANGTSITPGDFNLSGGSIDTLLLAFDNKPPVTIPLVVNASPPLGWTTPGAPASTTKANVAANINAMFAANGNYGIRYKTVASVATIMGNTFILLQSPVTLTGVSGAPTAVQLLAPAIQSAMLEVFGLSPTQLPVVRLGTGKAPAYGSIYFVTYSITRPTSDYNVQKRFFTLQDAQADLGNTTAQNPLMIAMEIAFANSAPSVVAVQVNDSSSPGSPTRQQFLDALNATTVSDVITDVVLLTTSLDSQTDLKDHIEQQSSPTEKHYRRGWFGMARNTNIGDKDTPGTFVFEATRTLQYAPDSPGRGRDILVAPPQLSGVSRDITLPDGTTQTVNLDSTFLAVALAAKKSSFTSPATSLAKKSITGFNLADQTQPWKKAERGTMAGQGVMVVTFDAGIFKILDPVTTEVGGGGLAAFSYESTSSQKDNVTRKVDQALDANVVGIVPTDLADFIIDIKLIIAGVLNGEIGAGSIGPFTNADGTPRAINLTTDLAVQQSPNDPTKFFFQYFYKLRYPALRLFGQFSVDNPFFVSQSA